MPAQTPTGFVSLREPRGRQQPLCANRHTDSHSFLQTDKEMAPLVEGNRVPEFGSGVSFGSAIPVFWLVLRVNTIS